MAAWGASCLSLEKFGNLQPEGRTWPTNQSYLAYSPEVVTNGPEVLLAQEVVASPGLDEGGGGVPAGKLHDSDVTQ